MNFPNSSSISPNQKKFIAFNLYADFVVFILKIATRNCIYSIIKLKHFFTFLVFNFKMLHL